jgi:hypothetical protein
MCTPFGSVWRGFLVVGILLGMTSANQLALAAAQAPTPAPVAVAPQSLSSGLVAFYPFNGNANDESGNKNDGTVTGATLATDRFGEPNNAYAFSGFGSIIVVPPSPSLSFANDLTVSAWIKTANTFGAIAAQHIGGGDGNFLLSITGGKLIFGRSANFWTSNPVNDDRWHHVVGVYDNARHVVSHYVDGVMVSSKTDPSPLPNRPIALTFGDESARAYALGAVIDDVRLYNRALSDAEVTQLFLLPSGSAPAPAPAAPIAPPVAATSRSLTGPWVPWADLTYTGVSQAIMVQDGPRVSLLVSRSESGSWLTMMCVGPLESGKIEFSCRYAPGGNPLGAGQGTMSVTLSADGNHLDGFMDWERGTRQPAHWTRKPVDSGADQSMSAVAPEPVFEASSPGWNRPGPAYDQAEGIITLSVMVTRPGTILDTVGLNAASPGSFSLVAQPDGRLAWCVYAPDVNSPSRDVSGWHRLTSDPVAPGAWHIVEIWYGRSGTQLIVDDRPQRLLDLTLPLSGAPLFVGDFPNDTNWEPTLDSKRGFVGSVKHVRVRPVLKR